MDADHSFDNVTAKIYKKIVHLETIVSLIEYSDQQHKSEPLKTEINGE